MSEATRPDGDGAVRPWRPPEVPRPVPTAPASTAPASNAHGFALLGAGEAPVPGDGVATPRRRWHEADDVAGLTALLGGRRPVRMSGDGAPPGPAGGAPRGASEESPDGAPSGADDVGDAVSLARAEGFEAGLAAGEASARAAFGDDVAELARAFARESALEIAALETELVSLARSVAACALRRELLGDTAVFVDEIRTALESLATGDGEASVTVRLHPTDVERLGDDPTSRLGPDVRIVADAALARADCRLERGASRIDIGVHARLEALGFEPAGGAPRDDS